MEMDKFFIIWWLVVTPFIIYLNFKYLTLLYIILLWLNFVIKCRKVEILKQEIKEMKDKYYQDWFKREKELD